MSTTRSTVGYEVKLERDTVVAALRAEDVAAHYDIRGPWRGRWMRSKRCPATDHGVDAMGLSRDGRWHCHACDDGGDLLKLIAIAEGADMRADFSRVLEIAAGIAGVLPDDDFGGGKPVAPPRAPIAPLIPVGVRLQLARKRAEWVWSKLFETMDKSIRLYLADRGLGQHAEQIMARETLRMTPAKIPSELATKYEELKRLTMVFSIPGVAIPVRSPVDGALVDIRVRRVNPPPDKPKIVGMLGGVVREGNDLHGCYGTPHDIGESDTVIVVEGAFDYLTALAMWPTACVLGATDAGAYPLVARHAAKALAERGGGRVVLVAQMDDDSTDAEWRAKMSPVNRKDGAADRSVDEASKNVLAILGTRGVAWMECRPHKDLNDVVRAGAAIEVLRPVEEDFGA